MQSQNNNSKIIIVLVFVLIGITHYFYTFPQINKNKKNEEKIVVDKVQVSELQAISNEMKDYDTKIAAYEFEKTDLLKTFPPKIYEENIITKILELNNTTDISKKEKAEIQSISFDMPKFDNPQSAVISEKTIDIKDPNEMEAIIRLGYKFKYSVFKNMMSKISQMKPKIVLTKVSMLKSGDLKEDNPADPDIMAQLLLTYYGYKDDENIGQMERNTSYKSSARLYELLRQKMPNNNIINPFYSGDATILKDAETSSGPNYDFFTIISPSKFDIPAVVAGIVGDGSKQVSNDDNKISNIEFAFFKNGKGQFFYKYKIENITYPSNYSQMIPFKPKSFDRISLDISNKIPPESTDLIGAKVVVNNNTDVPVEVLVKNDNLGNSRISVNKIGNGSVLTVRK